MGLSKKTFLYSIAIAAIMTAFIIGYFMLMLPSLYVDYVMKNNLKSVVDLQEGYRAEGSYDNLTVRNPSSTFSVKIPGKGNEIYAASKFFQMTITVQDEELQEMLDTFRDMMESMEYREGAGSVFTNTEMSDDEAFRIWEQIREKFSTQNLISESAPVTVQLEGRGSEGVYREEYSKIHMLSEESFVLDRKSTRLNSSH